ncbi:cytochrome P450 [Actinomadura barringtoniae]|uniref:Cytochrome P450 n=1 Tax=Actinomadura barringtoniae TaxID=1427535 RepID=A0A939P8I4_9ACTN|nr:cytochrome P450 [Actinomadura barringtoniae]MBO2447690.1 cytochrome P450 [Actinomadura barringtoniae]
MSGFEEVDFFTDESLVADPYPYYESLRARCPVQAEPHHGAIAVTGYDEATEIYRDSATFSNANCVVGPMVELPFEPQGDDIGDLIERHRDQFPMYEHLVTFDPPQHTLHRELLKKLFTPRRLKENEEFMWRLADRQIDEFLAQGKVEIMSEYAQPFALLVIADLLGVPEEDHQTFRTRLGAQRPGPLDEEFTGNPLEFLEERFSAYIEDRRREPGQDVLTSLANARFSDGSLPEVIDVVRIATFLFAAGQDTTARLLTSALQILAERPDLQRTLREERDQIPAFVEETLRMESPVKSDFRLARKTTTIGGVEIPAGSTVMLLPGAVNRDPARFECPAEFRMNRGNVREHLAFARGNHSCPGAPLARVEARVSLERLLDRLGDITISEAEHGTPDARRFTYEPTYILRGHKALHLEYTPLG